MNSYYFGVVDRGIDKPAELHLVPAKYWDENHKKYPGYIPDSSVNDMLEDAGYIECMENVYEFDLDGRDVKTVIDVIANEFGIEHNMEFQNTLF